jgi:transposase InsO family protein
MSQIVADAPEPEKGSHKERYFALLGERSKSAKKQLKVISDAEYLKTIERLKAAKAKVGKKENAEYYLLQTYEILRVGETVELIAKRLTDDAPVLKYVSYENSFEALERIHGEVGHRGRDIMLEACKTKYANLTVRMIKAFVDTCIECQKNRPRSKTTGCVVKPILCENFNSRAQMDLIDMQCMPDDGYKWIMVYQDHFSKFIMLRPLRAKEAIEVARGLISVFSVLGVPLILQSDNGKEFRNKVITSLKSLWPEMSFVHGRPRNPQSQGSVERCNADIKKMLASWMRENKSKRWSIGLDFVQLKKNHCAHRGIGCTPYKAVFGIETPLGLSSTHIPLDELKNFSIIKPIRL